VVAAFIVLGRGLIFRYSNSRVTQRQQQFRQSSHPRLDALHDIAGFGKRVRISLEAQGNEPG